MPPPSNPPYVAVNGTDFDPDSSPLVVTEGEEALPLVVGVGLSSGTTLVSLSAEADDEDVVTAAVITEVSDTLTTLTVTIGDAGSAIVTVSATDSGVHTGTAHLDILVVSPPPPGVPAREVLREDSWNCILPRISGSPAGKRALFTVHDWASSTYTRNTNLWCKDFNLSGLPISWSGNPALSYHTHGGALVTPKHLVMNAHYTHPGPVRFLGTDDVVYERTPVTFTSLVGPGYSGLDAMLVELDEELPVEVSPVKILSPSTFSYDGYGPFTFSRHYCYFAVGLGLWVDQYGDAYPCTVNSPADVDSASGCKDYVGLPALRGFGIYDALELWWKYTPIGGDSGGPVCLVVNDELVLWATLYGQAGCGWSTDVGLRERLAATVAPYELSYYIE